MWTVLAHISQKSAMNKPSAEISTGLVACFASWFAKNPAISRSITAFYRWLTGHLRQRIVAPIAWEITLVFGGSKLRNQRMHTANLKLQCELIHRVFAAAKQASGHICRSLRVMTAKPWTELSLGVSDAVDMCNHTYSIDFNNKVYKHGRVRWLAGCLRISRHPVEPRARQQ